MLGGIGGRRRRGRQDEMVGWHHQLNGREFEQNHEIVKDREAWRAAVHGVTKSHTLLSKHAWSCNPVKDLWMRLARV